VSNGIIERARRYASSTVPAWRVADRTQQTVRINHTFRRTAITSATAGRSRRIEGREGVESFAIVSI